MASESVTDHLIQESRPVSCISDSQEKSWYYYLSEIALRRIGNSILNMFYANDKYPGGDMALPLMVKTATNFLDQMAQW